MKNNLISNILGIILLCGFIMISCDDRDAEIDSLNLDRLLTPIGIDARVSKIVDLTLSWNVVSNAQSYEVEIYKDSMEFKPDNLVYKTEINTTELKYTLQGDTHYSAQVRSLSTDKNESKWARIAFHTDINSIFLNSVIGDIGSTEALFRWKEGVNASKIVLTPKGDKVVEQNITPQDIAKGIVRVTGLTPSKEYAVVLYSDAQRIGKTTITTLAQGTIIIRPEDDFLSILSAAQDNASFLVMPGEYLNQGVVVNINQSISIIGADKDNMPVIHAQLEVGNVNSLDLKNLIIDGTKSDNTLLDHFLRFTATSGDIGTVNVDGCLIQNYNKSLIAGESSMKAAIEKITINNSIVTNILASGADGIDIRAGLVKNLLLTHTTFNNVSPARDFIRLDDAAATFPSQTSNILIDKCTLYKVSNDKSKRIVYVRFVNNTIKITNTLFAETAAMYTNQSKTADIECSRNNYFLSPNFLIESNVAVGAKYDTSGNYTTFNPQFENVIEGNFKVNNTAVVAGDPRWLN